MQPFADHFSAIAPAYAAARPTYPPGLFAWLAGQAPSRRRAWDCAAGNGQATLALAQLFDSVLATDASAAQLAEMPARSNVLRRAAPAEASGLPDDSTDLVTVAQALHWLPLGLFWDEARRVLVDGGLVAVWCYGIQRVDQPEADRLVQRFYHQVVGPYWAPERRLVETGYATVELPFEPVAVPTFEMAADWRLSEFLAYVGTWSATSRYRAERGADPVSRLGDELAPHWGEEARRVLWPLSVRVGRSRRSASPSGVPADRGD
jgi:ubiquinone/menaquinone biosynthesis C-methylase UbiE